VMRCCVPDVCPSLTGLRRFSPSGLRRAFLNDAALPQIYTLSLHDALPICLQAEKTDILARIDSLEEDQRWLQNEMNSNDFGENEDRKSTRLNSSHVSTSYAVFCLKKKIRRRTSRTEC